MGACDTWNVEINILVYENEMFSLPAEFHFNNFKMKCETHAHAYGIVFEIENVFKSEMKKKKKFILKIDFKMK